MTITYLMLALAALSILWLNTSLNRWLRYGIFNVVSEHERIYQSGYVLQSRKALLWSLPAVALTMTGAVLACLSSGFPTVILPYTAGVCAFMALHSLCHLSSTINTRTGLFIWWPYDPTTPVGVVRSFLKAEEVRLLLWLVSWTLWTTLTGLAAFS